MAKSSKKQWMEWGGILAIFVLLFTTNLGTEISGFIKRGVLSTGLLDATLKKNVLDNPEVKEDFTLIRTDQSLLNFKSLAEKPTIVKFWATWCPSCIAELPNIEKLYQEMNGEVNVVLISVDDDHERLLSFLQKKNYQFPVYQLGSSYPDIFRARSIPRTYILDSDMKLVYSKQGMTHLDIENFKDFITSL